MEDVPTDIPSEITEQFEVVRSLGVGGQGRTMLGRRRSDGHEVVVKTLDFVELTSWKDLELLQREMKVLSSISHPAIPKLLDHYPRKTTDEPPPAFVVVQDFVAGKPLDALLAEEEGPVFDETQARSFLAEMFGILEYLHGLNPPVIHRDIKPSNIIRREDGSYALIDFGAANASGVVTGSTTFVGTNGYMPPEQLMGRAEPRSDLFALGATTIEMLTGLSPSDLSLEDLSFRLDVLEASPEFVNVLRVMTHPSPTRRYMSARRAIEALENPSNALVLGHENPEGFDVVRQADGLVRVGIPHKGNALYGFTASLLLLIGAIALATVSPLSAVMLASCTLLYAYHRVPEPSIELDDDELRIIRSFTIYRRTQRWKLDDISEVWTGPVPTKTGILIQANDGDQTGVRFPALKPEQHHWLGDLIRNHKESK